MKWDGVIALIVVYIFFVALVIGCVMVISSITGCNTSKEIQRTSVDSTKVNKADSGNVTKTGIDSRAEWEWWKATLDYRKDTTIYVDSTKTINHTYVTTPQPSVVVLEGGKGKTETIIYQTDSSWRNKYDSLAYQVEQVVKKKHTEVLTLWHLIGVGIGTALLIWLLGKLNKVKF